MEDVLKHRLEENIWICGGRGGGGGHKRMLRNMGLIELHNFISFTKHHYNDHIKEEKMGKNMYNV